MKNFYWILLFDSCALFVIPKEQRCQDNAPELSCDQNTLVFCDLLTHFQIKEDCGEDQSCNPNATPPRCELVEPTSCGNGFINVGEECDDGNQINGDGCQANCQTPR